MSFIDATAPSLTPHCQAHMEGYVWACCFSFSLFLVICSSSFGFWLKIARPQQISATSWPKEPNTLGTLHECRWTCWVDIFWMLDPDGVTLDLFLIFFDHHVFPTCLVRYLNISSTCSFSVSPLGDSLHHKEWMHRPRAGRLNCSERGPHSASPLRRIINKLAKTWRTPPLWFSFSLILSFQCCLCWELPLLERGQSVAHVVGRTQWH